MGIEDEIARILKDDYLDTLEKVIKEEDVSITPALQIAKKILAIDIGDGTVKDYLEGFQKVVQRIEEILITRQQEIPPNLGKFINDHFWEIIRSV